MQYMSPKELIKFLKDNLNESLVESHIETKKAGDKGEEYHNVWLEIKRDKFKDAVKLLSTVHYPHIAPDIRHLPHLI